MYSLEFGLIMSQLNQVHTLTPLFNIHFVDSRVVARVREFVLGCTQRVRVGRQLSGERLMYCKGAY